MTLQEIVDKYENGIKEGKKLSTNPNFKTNEKKPRRYFYYDIKYVLDLEKNGASDYNLLYACVFNRDRHLWLMSKALAKTATTTLYNAKILNGKYASFDELYDAVRNLLNPIKNIGDVAYYDISVRIGFLKRIQLYPQDLVYCHVHLRESARKLLNVSRISSFRTKITKFTPFLQNMPSIFIEDFLCSMHDDICLPSFTLGKLPAKFNLTIDNYFLK